MKTFTMPGTDLVVPAVVTAAAKGADIVLTRPEWYELYRAAGHLVP